MKILGYSAVRYVYSKSPINLFHSQENQTWKFRFSFFFPSFTSHITQKLYGVYRRSVQQTTALLYEIFLFLVRATWGAKMGKLWLQTHTTVSFLYTIWCLILTRTIWKVKAFLRMFQLLNNYATIGMRDTIGKLWFQGCIATPFRYILCVLHTKQWLYCQWCIVS